VRLREDAAAERRAREEQVAGLERTLAVARAEAETALRSADLAARARIETLSRELEEREAAFRAERTEREARLRALSAELREAREKAAAERTAREAELAELREAAARLARELDAARAREQEQARAAEHERERAAARMAALEAQLREREARSGALEARLASLEEERGALSVELASARRQLEETSTRLNAFLDGLKLESGNEDRDRIAQRKEGIETVLIEGLVPFAVGRAELGSNGERALARLLASLRARIETLDPEGWILEVEGRADSRPVVRAGFPSNEALAAARASAVVERLVAAGLSRERLRLLVRVSDRPPATGGEGREVAIRLIGRRA
ncbi:MAG: hypothetical protein RMK73_14545, partial [Geminicoccaceae bacterium]|nr:hypothetical protein [Geminicoccaceae bacterium]